MQSNAASSPFEGAATYYDRYRAPYAPETIEYLVSAFGLDDTARVLDLGCGPGTIAIPISRFVAGVLAVDPDAAMVVEGRMLAQERGRSNIQWRCSRAEDLPPTVGKFRIVTMGQSFHWMERDQVLHRLSEVVEASGGLALVNPGKRRPQESWEDAANKVVAKYLGPPSRHPQMHPEPEHEPSLLRSACFSAFIAREFAGEITRDLGSILGCLYSSSRATRPLFGDRAPYFEAELFEALMRFNPSGLFRERLETEVLLAPKIP
jgi:ubiquinone/menaquinone biosynthesis C-methylase UbiE